MEGRADDAGKLNTAARCDLLVAATQFPFRLFNGWGSPLGPSCVADNLPGPFEPIRELNEPLESVVIQEGRPERFRVVGTILSDGVFQPGNPRSSPAGSGEGVAFFAESWNGVQLSSHRWSVERSSHAVNTPPLRTTPCVT
jgi:hypothetical protein